jgi:hypothetical protein
MVYKNFIVKPEHTPKYAPAAKYGASSNNVSPRVILDDLVDRKMSRKASPKNNLTPAGNSTKAMKLKKDSINFIPGGQ